MVKRLCLFINPSLRRIASEKRADSDYSVSLNNVKGLEGFTPFDPLTNLEILHYAQNDRVACISNSVNQMSP